MHTASLHYAQIPYFLAFSTLLGWPVLLEEGIERTLRGVISLALGSLRYALISYRIPRLSADVSGCCVAVLYYWPRSLC